MQAASVPAVEGWGEYLGVRAAVLGAIGGFMYYIYETGWGAPTLGGSEVDAINAYIAESCEEVQADGWHHETDAGKANAAAVVQFENDIIGAVYNRSAVTKYFEYPSGLGGWLHREIDSAEAAYQEETEAQAETAKDTAWGAGIGALAAGLFTGGLGAPVGAAVGGLIGHKVGTDKQYTIAKLQQPEISPQQQAALAGLQAKILAKQAECQKEEQTWNAEWNQDFLNMIDYMAMNIVTNRPGLITHEKADAFFASNQVTLPSELLTADKPSLYAYIDAINAKYTPVANLNMTADELTAVSKIVNGYLTKDTYDMIAGIWGVGNYYDSGLAKPNASFSCNQILLATMKAGLSRQATEQALAPAYYLTRIQQFRGAWEQLPAGSWPYQSRTPPDYFNAPTRDAAVFQAGREWAEWAEDKFSVYYQQNPVAGPLWYQSTCQQPFAAIGCSKDEINAFASAIWTIQQKYCLVIQQQPYQPI